MRTLDLIDARSRGDRARRGFTAGSLLFAVVFLHVVVDMGGDHACEQVAKRRVVVDPDGSLVVVIVLVDVDLGEECLVEHAAYGVGGLEVGGVAVAGEIQVPTIS